MASNWTASTSRARPGSTGGCVPPSRSVPATSRSLDAERLARQQAPVADPVYPDHQHADLDIGRLALAERLAGEHEARIAHAAFAPCFGLLEFQRLPRRLAAGRRGNELGLGLDAAGRVSVGHRIVAQLLEGRLV